jgi:hypothetical protein
MQRTRDRDGNGNSNGNALKKEIVVRVEADSKASADAIYAALADLRTHTVWAGERQAKKTRLLTMDTAEGPAVVGTEFHTTGLDPMGTFDDRSVLTEASPGRVFEFVTDARLTTKNGRTSDWTNVQRYELTPTAGGTGIVWIGRITRIDELPGMVALFNVPVLRGLGLKMAAKVTRRTVRNLARYAEEREAGVA